MKIVHKLIPVFFLFISHLMLSQAVFTSNGGNWNSASSWTLTSGTDADGIPDADDAVIIKAHTVTVNVNATCASLTTDPDANNTTGLSRTISTTGASNITINANMLLTIVGDFFIKANNSYNRVTVLTGPGSVSAGSLTIGNDIAVTSARNTTLAVRSTTNFEILGNVNLYTNVENSNNNKATFRHDSGTITINGQMIMTQETNGSSTGYNSNLGVRQGTLILRNSEPLVLNPLGGTQLSQLMPNFNGCTVEYRPSSANLTVFNTNYRDIKINSEYDVYSNGFNINTGGSLYLIKGLLIGVYTLNTNTSIIRSGGATKDKPTLISGGIYNLTYAQNSSLIVAGNELLDTTTQLEKLTLSSTNGVQINTVCYPNQLIVNTTTNLTGSGDVRVRTLFDVPAAVTFNTGGIITLVSNITNTARVASLTSNPTINGNVNVERFLTNQGRKWRLVTAPLKGSTNNTVFYNWQNNGTSISGFGTDIWGPNGNPTSNGLQLINNSSHNLRRFNNSTGTWTSITNTFTETLFTSSLNKAFLLFATHPYGQATDGDGDVNPNTPQATTTLKATGNLITGNVVYSNVPSTTYFIVGNPYASPIDFKTILNDGSNSGIGKKIWFIDPTFGSYGAYVTWDDVNGYSDYTTTRNPGSNSNPANQSTIMQSGEAFFVKAISETSTLTIKETHKATTNSNAVFSRVANTVSSERLRVTLHKEENNIWNKKDAVVAGFYSGGNNAYDTNDVPKISNPSETLAFYTDTRSLSSEHRAPIQDNDFLMLRLTQTTVNSNYKLKIFTEDFSYTGQALLQDLFLNTITPFSVDGSVFEYDFVVTADALSSGNRFKIIFQNTLSNSTFSQENNFVIYPNPTTFEQGIHISTQQPSSEIYEYRIYNYLGQIVETNKITFDNQLTNISFSQKLNQGIYFLNIYDNQNVLQSSKSILIK
ncbi:T9SS type A sorting domain-containing protein [Flavobacterium sp. UBA6195]|uniref:T9SS type A sorting domain-containing protein n=1 Tax=Flavobacterium sp. UBA6195 TaxID=1946554 RepID=UPI0025B837A9|nr:T9SS type A sorting domain-containing protein [Flavobacterium sp. UBA6195]